MPASKIGVPRLDNYFDPNVRKYFISPQSVEAVIAEEKAKAGKSDVNLENASQETPNSGKGQSRAGKTFEGDPERFKELEREVLDLKIANRGKDFLIDQLQEEGEDFFKQLIEWSRRVGELETKLLLLSNGEAGHKPL